MGSSMTGLVLDDRTKSRGLGRGLGLDHHRPWPRPCLDHADLEPIPDYNISFCKRTYCDYSIIIIIIIFFSPSVLNSRG